ncbi:hypothetical protein K437DRAFT_171775 [Tilletiaria anomala UBC 951]|uniref:Uncharacterized protein n=1 Tax=Tilletiaria anomala (strain ATCC 24038 / CBS 436.72 / UBC 951) TaxID=1037660 RepID=A0A066VSQ3_TILAU|nr:uncharacterized protein K437DRAFT_171775 [Tilletiaria anomala UBC 951]KDN41600.1 hypothetical protein K437DRAFT_171775 [Tilletiaria anomala UBC 951]
MSQKKRIQYRIGRYWTETKRMYSVLDPHLLGRDWLAGEAWKIQYRRCEGVPMTLLCCAPWTGICKADVPPFVRACIERNFARSSTQAGMQQPSAKLTALASSMWDDDFAQKQVDDIHTFASQAQGAKGESERSRSRGDGGYLSDRRAFPQTDDLLLDPCACLLTLLAPGCTNPCL